MGELAGKTAAEIVAVDLEVGHVGSVRPIERELTGQVVVAEVQVSERRQCAQLGRELAGEVVFFEGEADDAAVLVDGYAVPG